MQESAPRSVPPALPPVPPSVLPEAPGARAARICGILAILLGITCVGIPAAVPLGIVSLVKHAKARRLAAERPGEFQKPSSGGLALGIVGLAMPLLMLPFLAIATAVAIPAYVNYHGRAADAQVRSLLSSRLDELAAEARKGLETGQDPSAIQTALEQRLQASPERNPADASLPAFRGTISVVSATTLEDAQAQAEDEAATPGEVVFVIAFPEGPGAPAFLAGAARLKVPQHETRTFSRRVALD